MRKYTTRGAGLKRHRWRPTLRRSLELSFGLAAGVILMVIIILTCADVIGRYLFDTPLAGAFELTEILVAALIFAALPLTTLQRAHVEVDLLDIFITGLGKRLIHALADLFTASLLAVFAWRLSLYAMKMMADGAVTNSLRIPLAPFAAFAALACLISAVITIFHNLVSSERHDENAGAFHHD